MRAFPLAEDTEQTIWTPRTGVQEREILGILTPTLGVESFSVGPSRLASPGHEQRFGSSTGNATGMPLARQPVRPNPGGTPLRGFVHWHAIQVCVRLRSDAPKPNINTRYRHGL